MVIPVSALSTTVMQKQGSVGVLQELNSLGWIKNSSLVEWKVSLPMAVGLEQEDL